MSLSFSAACQSLHIDNSEANCVLDFPESIEELPKKNKNLEVSLTIKILVMLLSPTKNLLLVAKMCEKAARKNFGTRMETWDNRNLLERNNLSLFLRTAA